MTWFDYAVVAVIGLSLLIGLMRGAVNEILALAGWVVAFLVANAFAHNVESALASTIASPVLRTAAAYALLFIGVLFVVMLVRIVLSGFVKAMGLGPIDRVLGGFVGFAKGVLIVLLVVLAASMTTLPKEPFWRRAVLSPWFETLAIAVRPWLPPDIARRINFRSPMKA